MLKILEDTYLNFYITMYFVYITMQCTWLNMLTIHLLKYNRSIQEILPKRITVLVSVFHGVKVFLLRTYKLSISGSLCLVSGPSFCPDLSVLVGKICYKGWTWVQITLWHCCLSEKMGKHLPIYRESYFIYCLGFIPWISISPSKTHSSLAFKLAHCK